jgi:glycosyltransferase involved in cell wall biosynthesis
LPSSLRVLILHSKYRSGPVSGENRVVEDEFALLQRAGHVVHLWDPVPDVSGWKDLARTAVETIWSREAARRVRHLVEMYRPQVIHCHNLFPVLSPIVLRVARETDCALIMTLHNYRMLCLPGTFVRDGRACEDCLGRIPWPGVVHRCYQESSAASAILATSLSLHRSLGTFDRPAFYLAVSEFIRRKHIQAGWPPGRIRVKHNFAWPSRRRQGPGDYFVHLGRLTSEKGVQTLLRAWTGLSARLVIVGDGPQADQVRSEAPSGVEFRGTIPPSEVPDLLVRARALLVPSNWYEGQPRGILEAYAAGVPVIASRFGGLPEVVEDGATGLLAEPGIPQAWRDAVSRLQNDEDSLRLGEGAWHRWREYFTPQRGLAALESNYREAMTMAGSPGPSVS